jgi:hypothetical protein
MTTLMFINDFNTETVIYYWNESFVLRISMPIIRQIIDDTSV